MQMMLPSFCSLHSLEIFLLRMLVAGIRNFVPAALLYTVYMLKGYHAVRVQ